MTDPDELLDIFGVAEACGVSLPTVRFWRRSGMGPLPVKGGGYGRKLSWRRGTVELWRATNRKPFPPVESDYETHYMRKRPVEADRIALPIEQELHQ
jgi:hypothetical protein